MNQFSEIVYALSSKVLGTPVPGTFDSIYYVNNYQDLIGPTVPGNVKLAAADLTGTATTSSTAAKVKLSGGSLQGQAQIGASSEKTKLTGASLSSAAVVSTVAVKVLVVSAVVNAAASVSAVGVKPVDATVGLTTVAGITATPEKAKTSTVSLQATGVISASVEKVELAFAALSATASLEPSAVKISNVVVQLSSAATLEVAPSSIKNGGGVFSASAELANTQATKITDSAADLSANSIAGCNPTKLGVVGVDFAGQASLLSSAIKAKENAISLEGTGVLEVTGAIVTISSASIASSAELSSSTNKVKNASISASASASIAGNVEKAVLVSTAVQSVSALTVGVQKVKVAAVPELGGVASLAASVDSYYPASADLSANANISVAVVAKVKIVGARIRGKASLYIYHPVDWSESLISGQLFIIPTIGNSYIAGAPSRSRVISTEFNKTEVESINDYTTLYSHFAEAEIGRVRSASGLVTVQPPVLNFRTTKARGDVQGVETILGVTKPTTRSKLLGFESDTVFLRSP